MGDNCIDHMLAPIGLKLVGGNAVNVGVHLARLGAQVAYFGAVGDDLDGQKVARTLAANGIDLTHLVRAEKPTAHTEISFDDRGDRIIGTEDFGACDGYSPGEDAISTLLRMDHVHIGWLNDNGALRRRLVAANVPVSQDIGINIAPENRQVMGLTFVFASMPGAHDAARAFARDLLEQGAKGVVVTRGADGSSAFLETGEFLQPALPTDLIDTTGAGDSFIAGFLHATALGGPPAAALGAGAQLAALTCRHIGGFPQEPVEVAPEIRTVD